jgi:hypothetical protein
MNPATHAARPSVSRLGSQGEDVSSKSKPKTRTLGLETPRLKSGERRTLPPAFATLNEGAICLVSTVATADEVIR